jgi:hypothetical protein
MHIEPGRQTHRELKDERGFDIMPPAGKGRGQYKNPQLAHMVSEGMKKTLFDQT